MANSQIILSAAQHEEIRRVLAQFGQNATVYCALLSDLSGQEISVWSPARAFDIPSIAALAAGDIMATLEISRMLGGERSCNLIIQEHDEMTILIARVGEALSLLLAVARDVPLGWARIAIRSATGRILAVVGAAALVPPPVAVTDDFATKFSAQLDAIW